ncbi:Asp-tRNA(Asn)/Glu-tRNA(Gln) amidotransferase subunit GatC [Paludicola sp. MB14-C6]|uniref:Asp-tRNA(Asn)/Glu-tRNA(Gln) amidotransferase subunit GatC n=1 Tax=Paludihabitans sp. MB14-C6 TaxID=3070656 RepID=UPI0027DD5E58|nr:Asp-tRNA(Asn)/Glu-tRNA(Gln) amidotransferase subunit GatC [Paludicola sp. MB14-C6]WMJ23368.1 Asp-tRNA(Asn)/Glu-tRNA(Gln) amidotransferase subunit GatC [Paludicola sp. MB14-C6]
MKVDIKHLAKLSRLNTTDEEEKRFEVQLQSILEMVDKLPCISSNDSLVDCSNPMKCREDVPEQLYKREEILSNAPQVQAGCVVVPKVIE